MLIVMGSGNRALQNKAESSFSSLHAEYETPSERARLLDALSDLHNLLEEYSPAWYTEEHRRKAESALHPKKKH